MTIHFACGHRAEMSAEASEPPRCGVCQESRIQRVEAPAPRFRGACSGPVVQKGT